MTTRVYYVFEPERTISCAEEAIDYQDDANIPRKGDLVRLMGDDVAREVNFVMWMPRQTSQDIVMVQLGSRSWV